MMMESQDEQVLGAGLLSRSYFPKVKFSRTFRGQDAFSKPEDVLATWSVADAQQSQSPCKRVLYGEIIVPRDLRPSFDVGPVYMKVLSQHCLLSAQCLMLFLQYMVGMFAFEPGMFIPEKEGALFQTEVQIVTDYAPGPRPRRYHEAQLDAPDDYGLASSQS